MAEERVTLKLVIHRHSKQVLFAEADKKFVDFLFTFLSLPLASVATLLTKDAIAGSFGNLYDSVENLSRTHLQPNLNKDSLLKPTIPMICSKSQATLNLLQNIKFSQESTKVMYRCANNYYLKPIYGWTIVDYCHNFVAEDPKAVCPVCKNLMKTEANFVDPSPKNGRNEMSYEDDGGYVKGIVSYRVMDDLTVKPMSDSSIIDLLEKFNVKDVRTDLENRVVDLDVSQGMKLLSASLASKTVLTDVFLNLDNMLGACENTFSASSSLSSLSQKSSQTRWRDSSGSGAFR